MENGPVALSWSGGKDSALTLAELRATGVDVAELLTNVTADVDRIAMHGVRTELVQRQAAALDLAYREIRVPVHASNAEFDEITAAAVKALRADGVDLLAFGDLHLADVRAYREKQLAPLGIEVLFPLWDHDSAALMEELLGNGYRAVVVCVDTEQLDASFCGRHVNKNFLADLPAHIDPAGENGEFHTFVFDGPIFSEQVRFRAGEQMTKIDRFRYQDLLPSN